MQKKSKKWNRAHFFKRKKSTKQHVGHPVYVYGTSGRYYKFLTFTHTPEKGKETDYILLKHNIDPAEANKGSYLKKQYSILSNTSFRDSDKKYRIHEEDLPTIRKYKK